MKRALAACLVGACAPAPAAPPAPIAPSAPAASLQQPVAPASATSEAAPPPPVREITLSDAELEPARLLARALRTVASNIDPRPVERGFAKVTTAQYRTDRRTPGAWHLVESATMALHHPPTPAEVDEPCKSPLGVGASVKGARGLDAELRLVSGGAHELWLSSPKPRRAKLPVGASHGACLGPDGTRVWISWSTRAAPPELFSVSLRDGNARPLRADARAQLAWVTSRALPRAGRRVTLTVDAPEAAWSPIDALLRASGFDVDRARGAHGAPARVQIGERAIVLSPPPTERCDRATILVGEARDALLLAASRGDCAISVAGGEDPVADLWARVVALAAREPG
ncbi:MAG: hypothetical protein IT374_28030 [Polyangiaceae bacterium]|nr:hypothetical protein [Polyangiaceae bacterium]